MTHPIKKTCVFCGEVFSFEVPIEGLRLWKSGVLIQNALPGLSANERELLRTGGCAPCWDKKLPPEGPCDDPTCTAGCNGEDEEEFFAEYPADDDGPVKCGSSEALAWLKENGHL